MFNASEKVAKLIDEYMKNHPELKIINRFKGNRWEINGDENGNFLSMGMSKAWREEKLLLVIYLLPKFKTKPESTKMILIYGLKMVVKEQKKLKIQLLRQMRLTG